MKASENAWVTVRLLAILTDEQGLRQHGDGLTLALVEDLGGSNASADWCHDTAVVVSAAAPRSTPAVAIPSSAIHCGVSGGESLGRRRAPTRG